MSWRFVRGLAALVTLCSVGIVLSSAAADGATGNPATPNVSPTGPDGTTTQVGSADGPSPFGPSPVQWAGGEHPHALGHATEGGTRESLASTNWAGYIASGTTFTEVQSNWTVPSVIPSQSAEYSAQWVGIDGVLDSDLIQTGTGEATSGGTTSYNAWFELLPANEVVINGTVVPGDSMTAMISEGSPGSWTIFIEDVTQGWHYTSTVSYPISAQTAEWIQEAPDVNGSPSTLADFGTTSFSSLGFDGTNPSAAALTDVDMTNDSLTIVAYPTSLTSNGFSVLYGTPRPAVTAVTPSSGSTSGGTTVTIEGNYLYGVSSVKFGGAAASGYLNSDGSLSLTAPPNAAGAVDVVVTTPGGSSASGAGDKFTYVAASSSQPPASQPPPVTQPSTGTSHGYWLVGSDGGIFTFGSAQFYGSTGSLRLQRPVVGIVPTADRGGYWLDASDGGVFAFGDSGYYGSVPGLGLHPAGSGLPNSLDAPIVGMVPSADGGGYFMVASDGGVFAFGDARFAGSCPGIGGCSGAAVAVMPDATGNGYWVVTKTGRVYTFGDAPYYGAPGSQSTAVTSAVRTPDGKGYWILFANGAIANYGDAASLGSPAGQYGGLNPASAIFTTSDGGGYWVASASGSVNSYGDAPGDGSMAGKGLNGSIIAATGW
jgi:Peptidase A4 family/IPT/TIG domain